MGRKKPVAIIQARMGSSRLPEKIMKPLLGKPVLWHVVNRVSMAKNIKDVVVATTTEKKDDSIYEFCIMNDFKVFRGSEDDVLDRYYQCAKEYNATDIARITSDCPLHDPKVIDDVVNEYLKGDYDYVTNAMEYSFPDGLDIEIFSFDSLSESWFNATLKSDREHVSPYIRCENKFKKKNVCSDKNYSSYRLTLDYPEDYEFISKIYNGLGKDMFSLDEIIEFLSENQELLNINNHFRANEGYLISLIEDAKNEIITGKTIYLKALDESKISSKYYDWLQDPEVTRYLDVKIESMADLKNYVKIKNQSPDCLFYGIFLKEDDNHIGNIKIDEINTTNETGTLGMLIGDKNYWNHGICIEASKLVVDYLFDKLNLKKISLAAISENKAAVNCYKKAGFKVEKLDFNSFKDKYYQRVVMVRENPNLYQPKKDIVGLKSIN